jgi:murein L,D-transpeptidase YafK
MNFARLLGVVIVGVVLTGCGLVGGDGRHLQPLSQAVVSKLGAMGSSQGEAMVMRIFKEESTLEVWKKTKKGSYQLFKTYEICAWSGGLGPKIKEGDRQSPEGFYAITPGLMNPKSSYYLAFNTGFPNKFDRSYGRTGADLMVHGDCSSRGCYAMTDDNIAELYALGREAFKGGQRTFDLQIYPFRMTTANMIKHRNSEHIDFWWNLKEGYDAFEISKQNLKWDVCNRQYVFHPGGSSALNAQGVCPSGSSKPDLMAQVSSKQLQDKSEFEVASVDLDAKEIQTAEQKKAAEIAAAQRAKEAAAFNAEVAQKREEVTDAVGGFFSNIFGGDSNSSATPSGQTVVGAPVPAPPLNRG